MPADPSLHDLASDVLAALVAHYVSEVVDLPARQYVSDGLPAWDCEQCSVQIVRTFANNADAPGQPAPGEQLFPFRGGSIVRTIVELAVEIVRCSPVVDSAEPDQDIQMPSPADIDGSAQVVLSDVEMVKAAIRNAVRDGTLPGCSDVVWAGWVGNGPSGGLVGGVTTLRIVLE